MGFCLFVLYVYANQTMIRIQGTWKGLKSRKVLPNFILGGTRLEIFQKLDRQEKKIVAFMFHKDKMII